MCTYSRTIYNCNHVIWGRRVKVCTIAEDFQQGILPQDCAFRKPHGLKSTKLARRCDKCVRLDERLLVARRKLKESQEEFGKRWIEPRRKSEEEGGSDGLKEEREYVGGGEEGWIYSEDGEIRTSKGGDVSHAAESIQEEISSSSILEEGSQLREGSVSRAHTRSSLEESQSTDFTSDAGSFLSIDDSEYSLTGDSNASPSASSTTSPSSSEAAETSHTTPGNTPRMLETTVKTEPKTTPKSRLALPVSRAPKVETGPLPPQVQQVNEVAKWPETPAKTTPRSLPKSRLAVPAPRTTPPRNVKPAETSSKLPRPGANRRSNQ